MLFRNVRCVDRACAFQFFRGTIPEAARFLETEVGYLTSAIAKDLPAGRAVTPVYPAPGYAMFQQGSMMMHRATRLSYRAERITFVPGFVARDMKYPDPTRDSIVSWDEPGIIAEFARHKAWLSQQKLDVFIEQLALGATSTETACRLRDSVADAMAAIDILKASSPEADAKAQGDA